MRLPFLQMESDLLSHGAPVVATLAGCSPVQAVGHVAVLRAWAVSQATDESPPDGWVRGADAGQLVEAAAQWQGEPGRLLRALRVAKLLEQEGESYRILGLEPYVHAWERNAKAKERMANRRARPANDRERSANTPGTGANAPSTKGEQVRTSPQQTQTQTQTLPTEGKARERATPPGPVGPSVDLHAALSAAHAKHEDGRPMPWSMGLETVHRRLLALAERSGVPIADAAREIAKRYDNMRQRARMPYEPARHKGNTLEELAKEVCWAGNAHPPPAEKAPTVQGPAMSKHDWQELPPVHQATLDAQLPPEPI